jgi:nucleotide-binding universal stress UspA family protein
MKIERIVVGVDFSLESERAGAAAADLAKRRDAEVLLVHALARLARPVGAPEEIQALYRRRAEELPEQSRIGLEEMRRRFDADGVRTRVRMVEGVAYGALAEVVGEYDADLLVVGGRGMSALERFLLGSVSERVIRAAPASVLVARGEPPGPAGYRRVLCAVDLSERAAPALDAAISLAAEDGAVDVFHCHVAPPGADIPSYRRVLETGAEELGAALLAPFGDRHRTVTFSTGRGHPVEEIVSRLEGGDHDLVVLGTHGRRGLRRMLLGSVAESVVRHAPCSALVAREKDPSAR